MLINAALTLYENDLTEGPVPPWMDGIIPDGGPYLPEIPLLRAGSLFITEQNLTLDIGRADTTSSGSYSMDAMATNIIYGDAYKQTLSGTFKTKYETSSKPSQPLSGSIERSRLISYPDASRQGTTLETKVSVDRPGSGSYPASSVHLELMDHEGLWTDMIWMRMADLYSGDGSWISGETDMDLSLDELGLGIEDARMAYSVRISDEGPVPRILFSSEANDTNVRLVMSAAFTEKAPWPEEYSLECSGAYPSTEGELSFHMTLRTRLIDWTAGQGAPVGFLAITSGKDNSPTATVPLPIAEVPRDGGETSLRFTPKEALEHARSNSPLIDAFVRDEPGVTFTDMRYYRNESRGPSGSMIWNITLTSGRDAGDHHPAVNFEVASQAGGDRLDMKRLGLLSAARHTSNEYGIRGRDLISLKDHESVLRSSPHSSRFFVGGQYAASHELRILSRSLGANVTSVLLFNVLGLSRAQGADLFVSSVNDARDPKTVHAVVIDGTNGRVLSILTASGHYTALIGPYVVIPA